MSENNSSVNEETKNVIRGVTPPEPKLLGTYINMVPISDSETSNLLEGKGSPEEQQKVGLETMLNGAQAEKTGSEAASASIPTSQFPMSAMNMEQLQQFMMKMQMSCSNSQPAASPANPGVGLGLGLGRPALNVNSMIPTSSATSLPTNSGYSIPPVGALDPNILASLGLNVQKPTLQPIQFPNMQAGVPNLCGIQGQDLNLAAWMQKQKIALALSGLQRNPQAAADSGNPTGSETCLPSGSSATPQNLAQSGGRLGDALSSLPCAPGNCLPAAGGGALGAVQSQLTPQLAAFLGNPNLVPSKDGVSVGTAHAGAGQIPGAPLGGIPGLGTLGGATPGVPGTTLSPESAFPSIMSTASDMSKIEAIIKQQQQQFIGSQLNAAAQLLRQHGIQATIGTEPLSGGGSEMCSKNKKPALLQRIVASKINPKIFIVPNALNQEECDEIISLIQDRLESSKISITKKNEGKSSAETAAVSDPTNDSPKNQEEDQEFCKSSTACIQPEETPLIREIEHRLGLLVDSNSLHMEPILVHKYSAEDYIKEHHDGDHRTHTISVFLSDVEHGGELDFPYAGIKIKPKKGLAVVWPNVNPQGKLDYTTVHAVNKITKASEKKECTDDSPPTEDHPEEPSCSYLLYLHINKEPVRLGFEASKAMQQVITTHSEGTNVPKSPKVVTQVTYPTSKTNNAK